MKILIVPFIKTPKTDPNVYLTQNLADLFTFRNHVCAVSADPANGFRNLSVYPAASAKKPLRSELRGRTFEEYLYDNGYLEKRYLQDDLDALMDCIDQFKPDCMIIMERPAAVIAARSRKIPFYCIVHPGQYRNSPVPYKCMTALNELLYYSHQEQEFNIRTMYAFAKRRFGFMPPSLCAFPEEADVTLLGSMSTDTANTGMTNRLSIYIGENGTSTRKLRKVITEAFKGAPYAVNAFIRDTSSGNDANIRFLRGFDLSKIAGSIAVIHDGNDYIRNLCLIHGVPQVMITDHRYKRVWNGTNAARNKYGVHLYEEKLSVSSLYEIYMKMLADDEYYDQTQKLSSEMRSMSDISAIVEAVIEDFEGY